MPYPVPLPPTILRLAEELTLDPQDVEESFIRGSGHGGQKINKTASTVTLRHRPTGIEVRMQKHREQSRNRLSAWKLLILKLEERQKGQESRLQKKIFRLRKQKQKRSKRAQEKVLAAKRHRSTVKQGRSSIEPV